MNSKINRALSIVFFFALSISAYAQGGSGQPASPAKTAQGKIGSANVSIQYSSPGVKGRTIWGGLVPYDKIWRAGANAATVFETDKDLTIGGKTLPAGKYTLFAIPTQKSWTIIFNAETGQWGIKRGGDANLDRSKDVLTVSTTPVANAMTENLTYEVNKDGIALLWEKLKIPVKIK